MRHRYRSLSSMLVTSLALAGVAFADYDSHPHLRPENRCVHPHPETGELVSFAEAGIDPIHCQRLFWDLPVSTAVGTIAVGAPFDEDPPSRFPRGITDRPPPMYVGLDDKGELDGFETLNGRPECSPGVEPGTNDCRARLCPDPDTVGWWAPMLNEDGSPVTGEDPTGMLHDVDDPSKIQSGPLFRLECRRGSRATFGPWQTGNHEQVFDRNGLGIVRLENTERLDRDVEAGRTTETKGDDGPGRIEWNMGGEYYNHFGSHHGTCYAAARRGGGGGGFGGAADPCDDPLNPLPREAYDLSNPDSECYPYQSRANAPDDPGGQGDCYIGDGHYRRCSGGSGGIFREGTQVPGRLLKAFPEGRGIPSVEDVLFYCDHHVVTQLPPGSYGVNRLQDYRKQFGGIVNPSDEPVGPAYPTPPGEIFRGAIGEMVIQYFTEPANADIKPLNWMFNALADVGVVTFVPPFMLSYKEVPWTPPYDLYMTMLVIHTHHRLVKGTINLERPPYRPNSPNPLCGGSAGQDVPPLDLYTNWHWEDALYCDYWRDPDGPIVIRKGEVLRAQCLVNNGITPEAIKHGLVAGSTVEMLRTLSNGAIPDDPSTMPTSDWSPALRESPAGQQLLFGNQHPDNYRVIYKCLPDAGSQVPKPGAVDAPLIQYAKICPPNPSVDIDGDYIDGPYVSEEVCGAGGWCEPSTVVWNDRAEDEMCIMVGQYYAMDRIGDMEGGGHDRAMEKLTAGDPERMQDVGTPGRAPAADVIGPCWDCEAGL